jgi:hypothetical protein
VDLIDTRILDLFFEMNGFHSSIKVQDGNQSLNLLSAKQKFARISPLHVDLVHLAEVTETTSAARETLAKLGWKIEEHFYPFPNLKPKSTVLILDELSSPVLATIKEAQWQGIKDLAAQEHKILWVTTGSQFQVSKPDNALIHGLARTMRAEDPLLNLITLDVESSTGKETVTNISRILKGLVKLDLDTPVETEFVEREGVLYVSRVRPSDKISPAEKKDDIELEIKDLHESETLIKLRCERVGTLDSLRWAEVAATELPIRDDMVEVEIVAAGLNFKVLDPMLMKLR